MVAGRDLNSSKISCVSLLSARIKMVQSKLKEIECLQHFSHNEIIIWKAQGVTQ